MWWKTSPVQPLAGLDSRAPIHPQLANAFSLPNAAVAQDMSAHTHALALEAALGGPELMAARVGTCAQSSLIAAQILRVREAWPDIWRNTGRVQLASSFLASLVTGTFVGMGEAEASATGLWVHSTQQGTPSHWDEGVLDIVGGNRDEGRRIWGWLGDVDTSGGRRRIGSVSRYLVDRYGFDPGESLSILLCVFNAFNCYTSQTQLLPRSLLITFQPTSLLSPHHLMPFYRLGLSTCL